MSGGQNLQQQQMASLFQKQIDALEKLAATLAEANKSSSLGGGSGSGGPFGLAGGGGGGGRGSPGGVGFSSNSFQSWAANQMKATNATQGQNLFNAYAQGSSGGLGLSAMSGMAGQAVGALGLGVGVAGSAMSLVAPWQNAAMDYAKAGASGYGSAPLSDTDEMARSRGRQAMSRQDRETHQFADDVLYKVGTLSGSKYAENAVTRAAGQRGEDRAYADALDPKERALSRTRSQLRGLAESGGMADEEGRKFGDEIYRFNLEREEHAQDFEKWARVRDSRMQATNQGAQSALQHG